MPSKMLTLRCYVTTEEHAAISAGAKRVGLTQSTYIKRVCLGQPTPSLEKLHARRDLMKAHADLGRLLAALFSFEKMLKSSMESPEETRAEPFSVSKSRNTPASSMASS